MKRIYVAAPLLTLLFIVACKHSPIELITDLPDDDPVDTTGIDTNLITSDCDPDTVYFENDIYPILFTNCAVSGCHDAETHKEGINMSTYASIMASDLLDLSDPWDSELIEVVTETDPGDLMPPPPAVSLTDDQIALLIEWQLQGALNNGCTDCDTSAITYSGNIQPIMNSYCVGCHDHSTPADNIDLTVYVGTGSISGVSDVAADGRLTGSIQFIDPYKPMPKGGTMLQDCLIDQVRTWVDEGYPDN